MSAHIWSGILVLIALMTGYGFGVYHPSTYLLMLAAAYMYGRGDGESAAWRRNVAERQKQEAKRY